MYANGRFSFDKRLFVALSLLLLGLSTFTQGVQARQPVALADNDWRTDFSKRSIDLAELSVNVPRDAIPSIDAPQFETSEEAAEWLNKREPVISILLGGHARAYPLQVLIWHEIVNDELAGVPITVTFCPLCYSALAFERRIDGDVYEFGVSGMLRYSDLVMYDRQTHSLFQQLNGTGIVGTLAGKQLEAVAAQIISFDEFRSAHPTGDVLSRKTGYQRSYGNNPYPGYDDIDEKPWLFSGKEDGRLPPMERVVTIDLNGVKKSYPHSITRNKRVINDAVGGVELVVMHTDNGALSALDKSKISRSRTLGSTGVYRRRLGNRILTFQRKRNGFRDLETDSEWDVTGLAIAGLLAGERLEPIAHSDMFSFAWFVINPGADLYE